MEIILILITPAIVGYLLSQSLPSAKFKKAQKLFNNKDYNEAVKLLNEIFDKHIDAPAKLAECKLLLGQKASAVNTKLSYFNEVVDLRKKIINHTSFEKYEFIESNAQLEIAKIQYENCYGNIRKLSDNVKFIDASNKTFSKDTFENLKIKHYYDLAESHYLYGTSKEKLSKHSEINSAINSYTTAKDYAVKSNNDSIKNISATRILICQLKLGQEISLVNTLEIQKADKNIQKDLYYRYSVQLIKNKKFAEAGRIISSNLNFQSPEINKLKEIIDAERNNNTLNKITEINSSIEKLYDNSLSIEDLRLFYEKLDVDIKEVSMLDFQLSEKISAIKPTLFNRLLTQYIAAEQYGSAMNLINNYPKFWESPEMLKNFGICCFGFTANGRLSDRNYRAVISGWLTSVFSDRVILKSLENTSWDDDYTFTLIESIGSNYFQYDEIPDNVNYDEISETNVSIGATQKELLQQFETVIQKDILDPNLSKLVNSFYDSEKEAIEKVIEIVDTDILFATPYFAISKGLNNEIINKLDNDYLQYSNEYALEAGIPYIKDSTSTIVYQYFYANDLIDRVEQAIKNEDPGIIKNLNTNDNKKWIEKFHNVLSSIEDRIYSSISNSISNDDENEKLILVMQECIAFSRINEKLKHQYSNFVANYCISKVNSESIDHYKALLLMKDAYFHSPDNPNICKNFITLIQFNLLDILNDRTIKTKDIYTILDWVKNNKSQTYKQNTGELNKVRREILQHLRQSGVDMSLFEEGDLYPLLSGKTLNSEGIKMKKVLNYMKDLTV